MTSHRQWLIRISQQFGGHQFRGEVAHDVNDRLPFAASQKFH